MGTRPARRDVPATGRDALPGGRHPGGVCPGYSEGGVRSRDWKSVPVRHWRRSGFDQPTWIDVVSVRVPRPELGPTGWLEPEDWDALW